MTGRFVDFDEALGNGMAGVILSSELGLDPCIVAHPPAGVLYMHPSHDPIAFSWCTTHHCTPERCDGRRLS